ncbi:hypothetical protein J6590_105161 [Homalodisca vitripennis]|nr:hypothetical protein J6590_105161 [Homalodisca vitripennis]
MVVLIPDLCHNALFYYIKVRGSCQTVGTPKSILKSTNQYPDLTKEKLVKKERNSASNSTGTPSRRGFKTGLTTSLPLQACRVGT